MCLLGEAKAKQNNDGGHYFGGSESLMQDKRPKQDGKERYQISNKGRIAGTNITNKIETQLKGKTC